MTSKERWTVYPLLLLAIGLALRADVTGPESRFGGTVSSDQVVCKELVVVGDGPAAGGTVPIIVHAGRVKGGGGGRIEIRDATGQDAVAIGTGLDARDGVIEFFDEQSRPVGRIASPTPRDAPAAARPKPAD